MFKISATLGEKYNMVQAHRVINAIEIWCYVWNLPEFKDRVLNYSWRRNWFLRGSSFTQNSLSNEAVYTAITALGENTHAMYDLDPENNGTETARTDTVTGITTIDERWLDPNVADMLDLVNTLSHEFTHTPQGGSFTHSYLNTPTRPYSVPYGIGNLTEEIAEKYFNRDGSLIST